MSDKLGYVVSYWSLRGEIQGNSRGIPYHGNSLPGEILTCVWVQYSESGIPGNSHPYWSLRGKSSRGFPTREQTKINQKITCNISTMFSSHYMKKNTSSQNLCILKEEFQERPTPYWSLKGNLAGDFYQRTIRTSHAEQTNIKQKKSLHTKKIQTASFFIDFMTSA